MLKTVAFFVTWCDIGKTSLPSALHWVYSRFFIGTYICLTIKKCKIGDRNTEIKESRNQGINGMNDI